MPGSYSNRDSHWKGGNLLAGNGWEVLTDSTFELHRSWLNSIANDGLVRYRWFRNEERLIATSPKALQEILVTKSYDFDKPKEAREALERLIGDGILLSEGHAHQVGRPQRAGIEGGLS